MLEIEISTKRYIKKYLQVKFGNPVKLTRATIEGSFLYEVLEDPRNDDDKDAGQFLHVMKVQLPDRVLLRKGFYLTPTQLTNFNAFMTRIIKDELHKHIDLLLKHNRGMEIREAIYDYQKQSGLYDDFLPFDSIKKGYYRYRIRNGGQIMCRKSVA